MCGICGFFSAGGTSIAERDLERMNDLLRRRGPDEGGLWRAEDGSAGLAMRRLSIIDLSSGRQPIFNEDGSLVVVFNGEIYNYLELREELAGRGHRFLTRTDTEVLVHGYEEWGRDLPARLRGMFAFAIYSKTERSLFLARDRLGIKPLYLLRRGREVRFASEQKPLLLAQDRPELDLEAMTRRLVIGFSTLPDSVFKGIEQLPPGRSLYLDGRRELLSSYWRPRVGQAPKNEEQAAARLRELLAESLDLHMLSDVPVGLTLSGGLDSSILAALMARRPDAAGLRAYTLGYGSPSDEFPFARLVNERHSIVAEEEIADPVLAMQELTRVVWRLEEPLSNVTALTAYLWARFIGARVKVTQVGEGADEVFGGYPQHRLFAGRMRLLPGDLAQRLYRLAFLQPRLGLATSMFRDRVKAKERVRRAFHDDFLGRFRGGLKGVLDFDQTFELSNNQLLRVDRMSMAHSLEARVPYLDHPLVEEVNAWPDEWKIRDGVQKRILRKAFADLLPPEVVQRPKIGKGGTQALMPVLMEGGLESRMRRILLGRGSPLPDMFSPEATRDLLDGRAGVYPWLGRRVRDKTLYFLLLAAIMQRLFIETPAWSGDSVPGLDELFDKELHS